MNTIKTFPFFIVLVPLFFVLHGFLFYFGFISPADAVLLALFYVAAAVVLYILIRIVFSAKKEKAAVTTAFLLIVYLFFGAIQDFFKTNLAAVARYSVLLPLLMVLLILVVWRVKKAVSLKSVFLFLNLLFSIYFFTDSVLLAVDYIHPPSASFTITGNQLYRPVGILQKPDIYFLIFDEYASSASLKENYGYDNTLDTYLKQQHFLLLKESFSNYNYTPASIASILNMSFIDGVKNNTLLTVKDMNRCLGLIRNNRAMEFLSAAGYKIVNCSDFNVLNNPSVVSAQMLPLKTRLITDNTLWSKVNRDILMNFYSGNAFLRWLLGRGLYETEKDNRQLLQLVKQQSAVKSDRPVVVFGHFYMPHEPFYYDKNGRIKDRSAIINDQQHPSNAYLDYLPYVNTEIKKLVDTIRRNTGNQAVIILMGDHGFREHINENLHQNYQNLNAVYFPEQNYHLFYDSVSGVNQFRIVFNTLFNQSIPLLKDSTIFLTGK